MRHPSIFWGFCPDFQGFRDARLKGELRPNGGDNTVTGPYLNFHNGDVQTVECGVIVGYLPQGKLLVGTRLTTLVPSGQAGIEAG